MSTKHVLDSPSTLVVDSLQGLAAINPHIQLDASAKVIFQASPDRSKVALICGGGSGHEPAHAAFVGHGMLNGAVCGNVFASPNANQVYRGIELVDNDKGTVIIVKNYTGDILQFGLAKERYEASHAEKSNRLRFIIVEDDVSVGRTQGSIVGRRGLAGTVLVYKIAGALAAKGASLDEVHAVAEWVSKRLGTVGVGLEHCHVPGTAASRSHLGADEAEIGMGIHNEPGHRRVSPVPPLGELIKQLLDLIVNTSDKERSFLPFKNTSGADEVVLLVNNLGGLSELELGGITGSTVNVLHAMGIEVHRVLSGTFMTSLNMPGFSLTLLLLPKGEPNAPKTDLLLSLLDEPTQAPGWKWSSGMPPTPTATSTSSTKVSTTPSTFRLAFHDSSYFIKAIQQACNALIAAEVEITRMDTVAGDGDCGLTLKAGAQGVLKKIEEGKISGSDVVGTMMVISEVTQEEMGGTSGALYSIFFSSLAQGLMAHGKEGGEMDLPTWKKALDSALKRLYTYTRARPGDRTCIDPLAAFIDALPSGYEAAVKASSNAAEATMNMEAKAGRSAYVEGEQLMQQKVPDPGAWGAKTIFDHLAHDG